MKEIPGQNRGIQEMPDSVGRFLLHLVAGWRPRLALALIDC